MDGVSGSHDQSGAAGGSAWVTTGTLSGSGGTMRAVGGSYGGWRGDGGGLPPPGYGRRRRRGAHAEHSHRDRPARAAQQGERLAELVPGARRLV